MFPSVALPCILMALLRDDASATGDPQCLRLLHLRLLRQRLRCLSSGGRSGGKSISRKFGADPRHGGHNFLVAILFPRFLCGGKTVCGSSLEGRRGQRLLRVAVKEGPKGEGRVTD